MTSAPQERSTVNKTGTLDAEASKSRQSSPLPATNVHLPKWILPPGGAWLVVSSLGASRPIESCGYKAYGHSPFGVSGLFFFQNGLPLFFLLFFSCPCSWSSLARCWQFPTAKKKSPLWRYRSVKKELEKPSESLLPRKSEVAPPQAKPYKTPVAPPCLLPVGVRTLFPLSSCQQA